jgi:hypothetical protein
MEIQYLIPYCVSSGGYCKFSGHGEIIKNVIQSDIYVQKLVEYSFFALVFIIAIILQEILSIKK